MIKIEIIYNYMLNVFRMSVESVVILLVGWVIAEAEGEVWIQENMFKIPVI